MTVEYTTMFLSMWWWKPPVGAIKQFAKEVRDIEPWVAASAMFGGALRMMNLKLDGALSPPLAEYLDDVVDCGWRAIRC